MSDASRAFCSEALRVLCHQSQEQVQLGQILCDDRIRQAWKQVPNNGRKGRLLQVLIENDNFTVEKYGAWVSLSSRGAILKGLLDFVTLSGRCKIADLLKPSGSGSDDLILAWRKSFGLEGNRRVRADACKKKLQLYPSLFRFEIDHGEEWVYPALTCSEQQPAAEAIEQFYEAVQSFLDQCENHTAELGTLISGTYPGTDAIVTAWRCVSGNGAKGALKRALLARSNVFKVYERTVTLNFDSQPAETREEHLPANEPSRALISILEESGVPVAYQQSLEEVLQNIVDVNFKKKILGMIKVILTEARSEASMSAACTYEERIELLRKEIDDLKKQLQETCEELENRKNELSKRDSKLTLLDNRLRLQEQYAAERIADLKQASVEWRGTLIDVVSNSSMTAVCSGPSITVAPSTNIMDTSESSSLRSGSPVEAQTDPGISLTTHCVPPDARLVCFDTDNDSSFKSICIKDVTLATKLLSTSDQGYAYLESLPIEHPADRDKDYVIVTLRSKLESTSKTTLTSDHLCAASFDKKRFCSKPASELQAGMWLESIDDIVEVIDIFRWTGTGKPVVEFRMEFPQDTVFLETGVGPIAIFGERADYRKSCRLDILRKQYYCSDIGSEVSAKRARTEPVSSKEFLDCRMLEDSNRLPSLCYSIGGHGHIDGKCKGACKHCQKGKCRFGWACEDCHFPGCRVRRCRANKLPCGQRRKARTSNGP